MIFYKVVGRLNNPEPDDNYPDKYKMIRNYAYSCREKSESFYQKYDKQLYCFISQKKSDKLVIGCILYDKNMLDVALADFVKCLELDVSGLSTEEITFKAMLSLLRMAEQTDFIEAEEDVLELFGLDKVLNMKRRLIFRESLCKTDMDKAQILEQADKMLSREVLIPEIERIFRGAKSDGVKGHPVHYVIESDSEEFVKAALEIVLSSLYQNNRISNKRYCSCELTNSSWLDDDGLDSLYQSCENGTVVLNYSLEDDGDGDYASNSGADIIVRLCKTMKKYRNKVLTVFCFPKSCEKFKSIFYENLSDVSLVELSEQVVFEVKAKEYLTQLAQDDKVTADEALYNVLEYDGRGYTSAELKREYNRWYDKKLKSEIYPQYSEMESAGKKLSESKPKGSAYDELSRMIGLDRAKAVIKQALDFFKAQKIYKEKGLVLERPAMHMVFTGNPGTAKTTVARLFARILKENGVLSRGELFEVGRADLVGKYVGWTAQIVKEKFKAAKGSVLFIDEAYSLVDDRSGMYGDEAINTIVQEMENNREDTIVIFAGYTNEMERFLQRNPGLRSRIAFHIPFDDYTTPELCSITNLIAEKNGMKIADEATPRLEKIFDTARQRSDFGNGRYARNVIEKAQMKHAASLVNMDIDAVKRDDIFTLRSEDFAFPECGNEKNTQMIGFAI